VAVDVIHDQRSGIGVPPPSRRRVALTYADEFPHS